MRQSLLGRKNGPKNKGPDRILNWVVIFIWIVPDGPVPIPIYRARMGPDQGNEKYRQFF